MLLAVVCYVNDLNSGGIPIRWVLVVGFDLLGSSLFLGG